MTTGGIERDSMVMKNYAMLCFGGVRLLVPQENVATVEASEAIERESDVPGAVGSLAAEGGEWPVFVLSESFETRANCPPAFIFCVAINCSDGATFAIACDDVSKIAWLKSPPEHINSPLSYGQNCGVGGAKYFQDDPINMRS